VVNDLAPTGVCVSFFDRIKGPGGRKIRYTVSIEGASGVFSSWIDNAPSGYPGTIVKVEESASRLDIYRLRQTSGGLLVELQDDPQGTLQNTFTPRVRRIAYVTDDVSRTATAIPMATADLPSSGTVYIGGETVTYTGTASGPQRITGCTRGAFGSLAQPHRGGSEQGASVFLSPPSWFGRRVRLQAIAVGEDGNEDEVETVGVYRLEEAPVSDGMGRWELRCSHLSDELAKRKLGQGIEEVKAGGGLFRPATASGVDVFEVATPSGVARRLKQSAAWISHAVVQFQEATNARTMFAIHSVDEDTPTTGVDTVRFYRTPLTASGEVAVNIANVSPLIALAVEWMRHVVLLQGGLPHVLMQIALTSRLGDGTNGSLDVLPGVEPATFGGPGFQMGAGMRSDEIDTDSLAALSGIISPSWSFPIDEEIPVTDLIESFCRATGSAAVYSRDGKLTFKKLRGERSAVVGVIASPGAVMGAVSARVEEQHTFARARIVCNYDPIDREFEGTVDVIDEEIAATYPNAQGTLEITDRAIMVEPVDASGLGSWLRPGLPVEQLLPALRRQMLGGRGGALVVSCRVDARLLHLQLGDLVDVQLPMVSDFRGGTLAQARGRIISRKPEWHGPQALTSEIEILIEEQLRSIAPVLYVDETTAVGGDVYLLESSSTTPNVGEAASPFEAFRVGDVLRPYRISGGFLFEEFYTVLAVTDSDMTVESSDGGAPEVGEVLILSPPMSTSTGTSADGFTLNDYAGDFVSEGRWR
jgi:hypothetical protein